VTIQYGDILKVTAAAETVDQVCSLPGGNNSGSLILAGVKSIGMALAGIVTNASGVETASGRTTIPVLYFDDPTEILLRIYNASGAAAEQQDVLINTNYELIRYRGASASIWFYALATSTTNANMQIVEKSPQSDAADDYGFVWAKTIVANRAVG
jgi:hypothetical protein